MVDNYLNIQNLLNYQEGKFFYGQILKRRKDNPGLDKDTIVIKEYYIDNPEYFKQKYQDIIDTCKKHNARFTLRLNARSYKKSAFKMNKLLADLLELGQYKKVKSLYSSVCGKFADEKEKKWIIDIDKGDLEKMNVELDNLKETINNSMPIGDKVLAEIPSNTGLHLITKPFDIREFTKKYPETEIKKDQFTNVFIP